MPVEYELQLNKLTTEENVYAAAVRTFATASLDDIVDRIMDGGSTVTRGDVAAVLEQAIVVCENFLQDGYRVNIDGLVDLFPRIRGKFTGPLDTYDPSRHSLDLAAMPGNRVRKSFKATAVPEKIVGDKVRPLLVEYQDLATGTVNTTLTRGNIGSVAGKQLAYDATAADEGLFLVSADANPPVKVSAVQKNKPGELIFLVPPDLTEFGSYQMEVRTRPKGCKELRVGRLDQLLMAA